MRYLNCYLVGSLFGIPKEGGRRGWYDTGEPLASVPLQVHRIPDGERLDKLDWVKIAALRERLVRMFVHLAADQNRFQMNGGPDVCVYLEDHMACVFRSRLHLPQHYE